MSAYECWSLDEIPEGDAELRDGYRDGRAGESEPGPNNHPAYRHGWWAGACDARRVEIPEWMRELARQYVQRTRAA